ETMAAYGAAHPVGETVHIPRLPAPPPQAVHLAKPGRPIAEAVATPESTHFALDGGTRAPSPTVSFAGTIDDTTVIPPDTTGAVGPNHVVEFLNSGFTVFNKAGVVVPPQISHSAFWSALGAGPGQPARFPSAPRTLGDHYAARWLVGGVGANAPAGDPPNAWVLVGISQTSDPTGAWNLFAIAVNTNANGYSHGSDLSDFDVLGFDPNNVVIT